MSQEKYGFSLENMSKANHDMIVLVDCHTGYCGEGWTDEHFINAGCNLDGLGNEMAYENASRFGSDGYEDEESGEWVESEDYYADIYHYQLSESGYNVNGGDPINNVTKLIIEHGGVSVDDRRGTALIYASRLKQLVYIPEGKEWQEYNVLIDELKRCFNVDVVEIA